MKSATQNCDKNLHFATPTKSTEIFTTHTHSHTPVFGAKTPHGSVVYNPFRRECLQRCNSLTFSPNVFQASSTPTKNSTKSLAYLSIASARTEQDMSSSPELSKPFEWSPEHRAELFPEDINENPVYQDFLEAHDDLSRNEVFQRQLNTFFSSQWVVPSPATSAITPKSSRIPVLSSISSAEDNSCSEDDVGTWDIGCQTTLSFPFHVDLWQLLPTHVLSDCTEAHGERVPSVRNLAMLPKFPQQDSQQFNNSWKHTSRRRLFEELEPMESIREKSCDSTDCARSLALTALAWTQDIQDSAVENLHPIDIPLPTLDSMGQPISPPICMASTDSNFNMVSQVGWEEHCSFEDLCTTKIPNMSECDFDDRIVVISQVIDLSPVKKDQEVETDVKTCFITEMSDLQ